MGAMRKIIYGINVSADGCCDHTKFGGAKDVHDYFRELLENADTILYGRKTYELMVPFWPDVAREQSMDDTSNAFARTFANLNRVVVSKTLADTDDGQTTIIRNNVRDEILRLKQQPGKGISTGGVEFPAQLIEWGLIDEFHIVVNPVIVGQGRRLFAEANLPDSLGLKLISSKTLSSGCVVLRYEKV